MGYMEMGVTDLYKVQNITVSLFLSGLGWWRHLDETSTIVLEKLHHLYDLSSGVYGVPVPGLSYFLYSGCKMGWIFPKHGASFPTMVSCSCISSLAHITSQRHMRLDPASLICLANTIRVLNNSPHKLKSHTKAMTFSVSASVAMLPPQANLRDASKRHENLLFFAPLWC